MADKKSSKKLQKFLKEKKFKTLYSFTESVTDEQEEVQFFNEQAELIFIVFQQKWNELEAIPAAKKGKNHVGEVAQCLEILKKIIIRLEQMIQKKWKSDAIGKIIQQSLGYGNKQQIRLLGFEILLYFIQANRTVTNEQIDELIVWFSTAVNMKPFIAAFQQEGVHVRLKNPLPEVKDMDSQVCPANADPTKDDAKELLNCFLDFISHKKREASFQFWFILFKEFYLSVFYPKAFKDMNVLNNDDTGFTTHCPYEIQGLLIDRFITWSENSAISKILWDPANGPLMLEIARQGCLMYPVNTYNETIKRTMDVFKSWLMDLSKSDIFGDRVNQYWRSFIGNVLQIFTVKSQGSEETTAHIAVCKQSVAILSYFSQELSKKLESETWSHLQLSILQSTYDFVNRIDKSTQSEQGIASAADFLFQALFFVWIKSEVTTKEMWGEFQQKVSSLVHWKATVSNWKEKLIQLTFILKDFIFAASDIELLTGPKKVGRATTSVPRDAKLDAINWNEDRITEIWFIMLDILGNINKISDPNNYEIAMSCMREAIELLLQAEQDSLQYDEQPPIPLYGVFLPVLLEGCSNDTRLLKGILIAYNTMCQLFLRQHTKQLDIKLLTHFYRAIHQGLCSNKEAIIYEIITSAKNIFSLNLPGANVLIGDFLREIDRMFNSALLQNIPSEIEKQALAISISLICYPDHLDSVEFPIVSIGDNLNITGPQSKLTSADMKMKISSILLAALTRETIAVKLTCLWGIVVLLCQELQQVQITGPTSSIPNSPVTGKGPRKDIVSSFTTELLNHSIHQNAEISQTALDALSTLALQYDRLLKLDASIVHNIISTLCNNIIGIITKTKIITTNNNVSESIVSNHFYCLIEWVMAASSIGNNNILKDADTAIKLFTAIEVGLFGDYVKERLEKTGNEKKDKKDKKMVSSGSVGDLSSLKSSAIPKFIQKREETLYSQLRNKPIHGSEIIREAAEALLFNTRFHFHNFPCPGNAGPEQIFSLISEDDSSTNDQKFVSFIYNDSSIVSIGQLPDSSNNASTTRVIIRDATGKYVWDAKISYDMALATLKGRLNAEVDMPNVTSSISTPKSNSTTKDYKRKKGEIPLYSSFSQAPSIPSNDDSNSPDILNDLLGFISETHPECLPPISGPGSRSVSFNSPFSPSSGYKEAVSNGTATLEFQANKEKEKQKEKEKEIRKIITACGFPSDPIPTSSFNFARTLLSHFGFLSLDSLSRFYLIEDNARFRRSLKDLDKIAGRQQCKIGVVYVEEGQEDQKAIFRNDSGSKEYIDFLKGLGWSVDLKTHPGFIGGLDSNGSCGQTAVYWANGTYEVIYHLATRMPTSDTDPQQIQKKRHIGNDIVQIIWSEHKRDYNPQTITSQFNDAHVIVYPLQNGLYRVQVSKKDKVTFFGPLLDEMVINKNLLPFLVRQTAINANRYVRYSTKGYKRPFSAREEFINEIVKRYKSDFTFDDLFATVYPLKGDLSWKTLLEGESSAIPSSPTVSSNRLHPSPDASDDSQDKASDETDSPKPTPISHSSSSSTVSSSEYKVPPPTRASYNPSNPSSPPSTSTTNNNSATPIPSTTPNPTPTSPTPSTAPVKDKEEEEKKKKGFSFFKRNKEGKEKDSKEKESKDNKKETPPTPTPSSTPAPVTTPPPTTTAPQPTPTPTPPPRATSPPPSTSPSPTNTSTPPVNPTSPQPVKKPVGGVSLGGSSLLSELTAKNNSQERSQSAISLPTNNTNNSTPVNNPPAKNNNINPPAKSGSSTNLAASLPPPRPAPPQPNNRPLSPTASPNPTPSPAPSNPPQKSPSNGSSGQIPQKTPAPVTPAPNPTPSQPPAKTVAPVPQKTTAPTPTPQKTATPAPAPATGGSKYIPYEQLKNKMDSDTLDGAKLEQYLSDAEFEKG